MKPNRNEVRVQPEFPEFQAKGRIAGFFLFLFGSLIWLFLIVVFVVGIYIKLVSEGIILFLQMARPGQYTIPFWFSLLLTVFFFPVTLFVVLAAATVKIFRESH